MQPPHAAPTDRADAGAAEGDRASSAASTPTPDAPDGAPVTDRALPAGDPLAGTAETALPTAREAGLLDGAARALERALAVVDTGRWNVWFVLALGALLWLPALGRVGLWDPWETHYAEVAREMLERGDFVHPYWESAYFFSKPIFTFWLMAAPMSLLPVASGTGALPHGVEWAVRLPFVACALLGLVGVYILGARLFSKRTGLVAALVLATCPQYTMLAKQAMVDMPLVGILTFGIACMATWLWAPEHERPRHPLWAYALYALAGVATLTKESLGIAIPGLAFGGTLLVATDWSALFGAAAARGLPGGLAHVGRLLWDGARRIRLLSGAAVFTAVAAPWYAFMWRFQGVDDESKTFAARIYHDNFARLAKGVHTTTPGGTFTYFVEQLGFGMFPWTAVVPLALAAAALRVDAYFRARRAGTATPAQAAEAHGLLLTLVWSLGIYALMTSSATKFHHYAFPSLPAYALCVAAWAVRATSREDGSPRLAGTGALFGAIVLFAIVGRDLAMAPKAILDLFVYNYERPYPTELDPRLLLQVAFGAVGGVLGVLVLGGFTRAFAPVLAVAALALGLYNSHVHYNRLGPHWSQRTLTDVYWREKRGDEPLIAYQMNWRGETFYSRNTVLQVKDAARLKELVEKDGRDFIIVEQGRYRGMLNTLGKPFSDTARILDQSTNKFYLVAVD